MVDTPKLSWFGLITPEVLGKVGGGEHPAVDPRAADRSVGDNRNRLDPSQPSNTQDVYGVAEEQRNVHRGR